MRVDGATTFLTIAEASRRARLSPRSIRRALAGEVKPLRHFRIGRRVVISEADLAAWLEAHAVMPTIRPKVLEGVEALFPELAGHLPVTQTGHGAEKTNGYKH